MHSNLPKNKVILSVMSGEFPDLCKRAEALGIKIIRTNKVATLPIAEAYHADMQLLHIEKDKIFLGKNATFLKDKLNENNIPFKETAVNLENKYPNNVLLNVCILKEYIICNTNYIDKNIYDFLHYNEKIMINVPQGYTKCAIAVISDNAVITSDNGIYQIIKKYKNLDVLKISEGDILLNGHNYGFIGGCCGKISNTDLIFTGNLQKHHDYENIKSFCKNYNVTIHSLTNQPLVDIGGILPILELDS